MIPVVPSTVALGQLLSQYQGATYFRATTAAWLQGFDTNEIALADLSAQLSPWTASGPGLDACGGEVGFPRNAPSVGVDVSDPVYRSLIFAAGAANHWKGDIASAIDAMVGVVNSDFVRSLRGSGVAPFAVYGYSLGNMSVAWQIGGLPTAYPGEAQVWIATARLFLSAAVRLGSISWRAPALIFGFPGDTQTALGPVANVDMTGGGPARYFAEEILV